MAQRVSGNVSLDERAQTSGTNMEQDIEVNATNNVSI
jgi:hypothetical protein